MSAVAWFSELVGLDRDRRPVLTAPRRAPYVVLLGRYPCSHAAGNALEQHPDNAHHVICRRCGEILDVVAGHDPRVRV